MDLPGPALLDFGDVELEEAVEPLHQLLSVGGAIVSILIHRHTAHSRRPPAGRLLTAIHPCCGGVFCVALYYDAGRAEAKPQREEEPVERERSRCQAGCNKKNRVGRNCLGNCVDVRRLGDGRISKVVPESEPVAQSTGRGVAEHLARARLEGPLFSTKVTEPRPQPAKLPYVYMYVLC